MDFSNQGSSHRYSFVSAYEKFMPFVERAGLSQKRRQLLGQASGKVLEIGAGTGLNLPHYKQDVELVAVEPDAEMAVLLKSRCAGRMVEIIQCPLSEILSSGVEPHSFDYVVASLVLCSVPDVDEALDTISQLLRPGGKFLFIEHVVTPGIYEILQKLATPLWKRAAGGCHLDRDLLGALDHSEMVVTDLIRFNFPLGRPLLPHGIMGTARLKSDFFG